MTLTVHAPASAPAPTSIPAHALPPEPIRVIFPDSFLGVVMLDMQFPRPEGDIGHLLAFGVPTRRCVITCASPEKIVQSGEGLRKWRVVPPSLQRVRKPQRHGTKAFIMRCRFLVLLAKETQAQAKILVITSSLL